LRTVVLRRLKVFPALATLDVLEIHEFPLLASHATMMRFSWEHILRKLYYHTKSLRRYHILN
jgi:hypothetical protein